jgi:hypothetical protein
MAPVVTGRIAVRRGRFSGSWWVYEPGNFGTWFDEWDDAMVYANERARQRFADRLYEALRAES